LFIFAVRSKIKRDFIYLLTKFQQDGSTADVQKSFKHNYYE
jgi:hypothetical protein